MMSTTNKFFFLGLLMIGLSACAKVTFVNYTGNMPSDDKIEQLRTGMDQSEVRGILGSPSSVVSLDRNTWIYMSSEIEQIAFMKPEETDRKLLVVKFDNNGKIATIQHLDRSKGKDLQISEQKTATPEQEQGFFRKYFGGVGQFVPFSSGNGIDNQ